MPRRPLASQTIRAVTRDRHSDPFFIDEAVLLPWLALDSREARNVIAVDVDHADGPDLAAQLADVNGLPRPTLVLDPWSGRSHAIWLLATPVITTESSRGKPRALCNLAAKLLAAAMRGTPLPQRSLLKNPWGQAENLIGQRYRRGATPAVPALWEAFQEAATGLIWHTEPGDPHALELRDVIAALADEHGGGAAAPRSARFRKKRGQPDSRGRNCSLFDNVRWWAYDHRESDAGTILEEALSVNNAFPEPLPAAEVRALAKSIARFMTNRFSPRHGPSKQRGRDRIEGAGMDTAGRRELAGRRSAEARKNKTDTRILAAMQVLRSSDRTVTQTAVAAEAGVGVSTVARRWRLLKDPSDGAVSGNAPSAAPLAVTSALHPGKGLVPATPTAKAIRTITSQQASLRPVPGPVLSFRPRAIFGSWTDGRLPPLAPRLAILDCLPACRPRELPAIGPP